MKNIRIFIWKFSFFLWWNFQYIWIGVFSQWDDLYGRSSTKRKNKNELDKNEENPRSEQTPGPICSKRR